MFERERFFSRVARANKHGHENNKRADLDEYLAAIEPVDRSAFEIGISEERVVEKRESAEINSEVKRLPCAAAKLNPKIGSDYHQGHYVKGDGTDAVFQRLLRRTDWIDQVDDAKMWRLVEEKHDGMNDSEEESDIACPIVEPEIVEAAMRPGANRAIAKGHQHAEKRVDRECSDGDKAEICRQIEKSDVH